MPHLSFTPWKDHSQVLAVRAQFYPSASYNGPDMRSRASALVWAWKVRGNLPHEVEATALLTDAMLHDDAAKNSMFSIRATYSSAFCRFVTGLVDSRLHGRKYTMYRNAMKLGIPASFVELRHEATHRELPSLRVLRDAARRALDWLWGNYWAGIGDSSPMSEDCDIYGERETEQAFNDRVSTIIQRFLTQKPGRNGVERDPKRSSALLELADFCSFEREKGVMLARVLLHPKFMLSESGVDNRMSHDISAWDELLKELCRHNTLFLTQFVEVIVALLMDSSAPEPEVSLSEASPYQKKLYALLEHVLKSDSWTMVRRQHLHLSYALEMCRDGTGYWKSQLHSLMGCPNPMYDSLEKRLYIPPKSTIIQDEADIELEETDLECNSWSIDRRRGFKPIGAV